MAKRRLLYFSIGTFAPMAFDLEGNIYGKNLVRRLVEDADIELFVVNAGNHAYREDTQAFFRSLGIDVVFIPVGPLDLRPESDTFGATLSFMWKSMFRMQYEMEAHNQKQIAEAAERAIVHWCIEHILVDYVPAVLYWPTSSTLPFLKRLSPSTGRPICTRRCYRSARFRTAPLPAASVFGGSLASSAGYTMHSTRS
jgi:hypothetical protein